MKKSSLIIGTLAAALCICAAAVLLKVVLTPASRRQETPDESTAATEPDSLSPSQTAQTDSEADTSATEPSESGVTASGNIAEAPAPIDLDTNSITLLVNRDYTLSEDYVPDDLVVPDVRFTFSYYDDKKLMRKEAADALEDLFEAADEAGIRLYGVSAYRSYSRQYTIYATNLITRGVNHTNRYSAAPGASEHQTGLAIDVTSDSAGQTLEEIFGRTEEGIWLSENSYRFGFIIRYPEGMEDLTGYYYEPWHIRYVGTELAEYLYEHDLTLDEYYGYTPSVSFASLADTPLIDITSDRYQSLYRSLTQQTTQPSTDRPISDMSEEELADSILGTEPVTDQEPTSELTESTESSESSESSGTTQTTEPSESTEPSGTTGSIEPSESTEPSGTTQSPEPSESTEPSGTTQNPEPSESTEPSGTTQAPEPSESTEPSGTTQNPEPSESTELFGTTQAAEPSESTEPSEPAGVTEASEPPIAAPDESTGPAESIPSPDPTEPFPPF